MSDAISFDTICAVATPPGTAGLSVVRVSGPSAVAAVRACFSTSVDLDVVPSHTIHYGWWRGGGGVIDSVTCSVYRAPHSYTGEDVIEIGCHGGLHVVDQIMTTLLDSGVRLADPGEFTKRAFLNHKLDLTQVEAVADLIASQSRIGAQTAARQLAGGFTKRLAALRTDLLDVCGLLELELDFSEEDVEFVDKEKLTETLRNIRSYARSLADTASSAEVLRSGFYCAVVGYPNAGKSSLFNALLSRDRAIVSDIAGTTRDYLEETIFVDGYAIHLYDTAGLRETEDSIELQGIRITTSLIEQSDLVLVVNDITVGNAHSDTLCTDLTSRFPDAKVVVVQNKVDGTDIVPANDERKIYCSALTGAGVPELRAFLARRVAESTSAVNDVLVNGRQAALLRSAADSLTQAIDGLGAQVSNEYITVDIRAAIRLLGDITGETWNVDVLDTIFSRFCIGK
ncbi:MAG: tRNA uridine-5-carboxymethylaminomethyl(34) synthesis GTPase MnmE [Bacteroidetes bacterium]|nr:tRNA uridine-5-carboxymethylaminomethyl(34) synthesis GTPase MnmE [Bacteroidota bacterium]